MAENSLPTDLPEELREIVSYAGAEVRNFKDRWEITVYMNEQYKLLLKYPNAVVKYLINGRAVINFSKEWKGV
jgi:hypothetical protein